METMPYLSVSSSASLVVLEAGTVRSFPLEGKQVWKIGRKNPESESDIELESKIVSRKHGRIQSVDGAWYYIEEGSLNGTYYNGEKIKRNDKGEFDAVKLTNGDILRIDSDSLNHPEERGVLFLFTTEGIGNQWKTAMLRKNETSFGRNTECDVVIPLPYASGKHMVILKRSSEYFVMDCDSMAGTWLNGEEIHGEVKLKEKDMIAICDCTMFLCENKIIYNVPVPKNRNVIPIGEKAEEDGIEEREDDLSTHPVVLRANIKSRKVKNNRGFGKKELIGNWGFTNVTKNWNWKDADQKPVQVAVFSNGDEVELIQNGTSVGKLTSGTRLAAELPHSFLFDLTYLPGTLEAVSYKDGKEISRDTLVTTGPAKELRLIQEKKELSANGHEVAYIRVEIVDENGIVVPDAALRLSAAVEGVGSLAAFGSSNPITDENYTSGTFTSYHGTATAIIRSGYQTGMCTLTVGCEGLDEKKIAFTIK